MRVGIVDADLIYRSRQRFPNLACMKLSGYFKEKGYDTKLLMNYQDTGEYDKVYIAKVFTDTDVPEEVLCRKNVEYGGTGFFYDSALPLPEAVEHHMPDYSLYSQYVEDILQQGGKESEYKFYKDYSLGFLTRGCFRKCGFCVNRKSTASRPASPLMEFMDTEKKKLCFLDDNFLACSEWEPILESVLESDRRFQFRQGLDIRIMQKRQMEKLFSGKMDGSVLFAFDDIADEEIIRKKLELLYETVQMKKKELKFYVLCGFDRNGEWNPDFWLEDIRGVMDRICILMQYGCLAYVMRYKRWEHAPEPYRGMYINISRWCNQPAQYRKKSIREFCMGQGEGSSAQRYFQRFLQVHPEMVDYMDMKWEELWQHTRRKSI